MLSSFLSNSFMKTSRLRHIVSGPTASVALVPLGDWESASRERVNVRAVFHYPAEGRRKIAFACSTQDLREFLAVLHEGRPGDHAKLLLASSRGEIEAKAQDAGMREVLFSVASSRTRVGAKGRVAGSYRTEKI